MHTQNTKNTQNMQARGTFLKSRTSTSHKSVFLEDLSSKGFHFRSTPVYFAAAASQGGRAPLWAAPAESLQCCVSHHHGRLHTVSGTTQLNEPARFMHSDSCESSMVWRYCVPHHHGRLHTVSGTTQLNESAKFMHSDSCESSVVWRYCVSHHHGSLHTVSGTTQLSEPARFMHSDSCESSMLGRYCVSHHHGSLHTKLNIVQHCTYLCAVYGIIGRGRFLDTVRHDECVRFLPPFYIGRVAATL